MDPAFLRRLPYKIEVGAPASRTSRRSSRRSAEKQGMELTDEVFDSIVHKLATRRSSTSPPIMPRFIIDQIVATCRFMGQPPHFEPRYIDYALDNLRVKRSAAPTATKPQPA